LHCILNEFLLQFLSLTFSGTTGLLKGLTNTEKSLSVELSNELLYYKSHVGNNQGGENQASGAYIFRPDGNDPHQIATGGSVATNVVQVISKYSRMLIVCNYFLTVLISG